TESSFLDALSVALNAEKKRAKSGICNCIFFKKGAEFVLESPELFTTAQLCQLGNARACICPSEVWRVYIHGPGCSIHLTDISPNIFLQENLVCIKFQQLQYCIFANVQRSGFGCQREDPSKKHPKRSI